MNVSEDCNPEIQALLVKAADGLLDERERNQLEQLCEASPSLKKELEALTSVRTMVERCGIRDPNPGDWDEFERRFVPRSMRLTGWFLVLSGYLALLGTGLWFLFADPEAPMGVRVGVGAIIIGLGVLFGYVGRGFIRERSKDPYKNVVR